MESSVGADVVSQNALLRILARHQVEGTTVSRVLRQSPVKKKRRGSCGPGGLFHIYSEKTVEFFV